MSELGEFVNKYKVAASLRDSAVAWTFSVETANGERYDLDIIDGAEIPLLLDLVRSDRSVYYDHKTRTICSGWNDPGS